MTNSLSALSERLTPSVPNIGELIEWASQSEELRLFVDWVRQYLPDKEQEIMRPRPPVGVVESPLVLSRVETATHLFRERYFPISDWCEDYAGLIWQINFERMGLSYDEYLSLEGMSPGIQLLTLVSENPFGDYGDGDPERAQLFSICAGIVGEDLAKRVLDNSGPAGQEGWHPRELNRLMKTRFEGAALWAYWLWREIDNVFLCSDYEEEWDISWHPETVAAMTRQWKEANQVRDVVLDLAVWLEESPVEHFQQLLDAIAAPDLVEEEGRPRSRVEVYKD